jgi:hypothetical protein
MWNGQQTKPEVGLMYLQMVYVYKVEPTYFVYTLLWSLILLSWNSSVSMSFLFFTGLFCFRVPVHYNGSLFFVLFSVYQVMFCTAISSWRARLQGLGESSSVYVSNAHYLGVHWYLVRLPYIIKLARWAHRLDSIKLMWCPYYLPICFRWMCLLCCGIDLLW